MSRQDFRPLAVIVLAVCPLVWRAADGIAVRAMSWAKTSLAERSRILSMSEDERFAAALGEDAAIHRVLRDATPSGAMILVYAPYTARLDARIRALSVTLFPRRIAHYEVLQRVVLRQPESLQGDVFALHLEPGEPMPYAALFDAPVSYGSFAILRYRGVQK
jgi:hypothetical protein